MDRRDSIIRGICQIHDGIALETAQRYLLDIHQSLLELCTQNVGVASRVLDEVVYVEIFIITYRWLR